MLLFTGCLLALICASACCCWSASVCHGKSFITGRSHCDHCAHPLVWWQLIPLLGVLLQRGKCRYCAASIPLQSTRWELLFAGGWLASYFWWQHQHYFLVCACLLALWSLPLMHQDATLLAVSSTWLIGGAVVMWLLALWLIPPSNWDLHLLCAIVLVPLLLYAVLTKQLGAGDGWYCWALSALGGYWLLWCLLLASCGLLLRQLRTKSKTAQPLIWALGLAHWLLLAGVIVFHALKNCPWAGSFIDWIHLYY